MTLHRPSSAPSNIRNLTVGVNGRGYRTKRALYRALSRPMSRNTTESGFAALPLQVTSGAIVFVKSAKFEYQGPATNLQIGVGWKAPANTLLSPNPLDFNNGQNLMRAGDGGYGFSPLIGVPAAGVFTSFTIAFTSAIVLLAPVIGTNIRVSGATFQMNAGQKADAWVWMYDVNQLGQGQIGPDTGFLIIDNDSGVIELKSAAAGQAARNLDVEYAPL